MIARLLEIPLVMRPPFERRDAIVVLGSPLGPANALTPVLAERVAAAVALYRRGGGDLVIASGGITRDATRAEADVLADALRAAGIAEVSVERRSQTTVENARYCAPLLANRRAWIVTQPFHGRRAARAFRAAGVDALAWHIDDSIEYRDRARATRWLVREYAAWAKQLLGRGRR